MDAETVPHPDWREDVRLTDCCGNESLLPLRKVRAIIAILA